MMAEADRQDYLDEVYNFVKELKERAERNVPYWHTYELWYGKDYRGSRSCNFCKHSTIDSKCTYIGDMRYLV